MIWPSEKRPQQRPHHLPRATKLGGFCRGVVHTTRRDRSPVPFFVYKQNGQRIRGGRGPGTASDSQV